MAARIRGRDWATTPLGPIELWPVALRTAVDLMLECVFPASLHCGPHDVQLYNDAYIPLIGTRHPIALGAGTLETFADLRDTLEPLMARIRAGETVRQEAQHYRYARDGAPEDTWFTLSHQPVRDEGRVIAVLTIGVEVTERVRAERRRDEAQAELERRAARQGFLLRLSDAVRAVSDPPRVMALAAEALGRELGLNRCGYGQSLDERGDVIQVEGEWTNDAAHALAGPCRLDEFGSELAAQMRAGETVRVDDVLQDPRTRAAAGVYAEAGVRAMVAAPLVKDGRFVALLYAHQATPRRWTDDEAGLVETLAERTWGAVQRVRAETALRTSQACYSALVKATSDSVYRMSPDWTELRQLDGRGFLADTEKPSVGWVEAYLPPEEQPRVLAAIAEAVASRGVFQLEHRVRQEDGSIGWTFSRAIPVLGPGGEIVEWFGAASDVTERRRAEERLELVVNELNHRVKNNLAIVQAMAAQTFRDATDAAAAAHDFTDRLVALARANDLLTAERAASVDLGAMARRALAAHLGEPGRLDVSGPPVWLPAPMALALSMALHELGTNAVKYGAWSRRGGEVRVVWSVGREAGDPPRLRLAWRERGGPPVSPPARRGFGSRLIERALAAQLGGSARLLFEPGGLVCQIEAQLAEEGSQS
jgi:two-component sensor histidine kinase/GAF domain-containing protein